MISILLHYIILGYFNIKLVSLYYSNDLGAEML